MKTLSKFRIGVDLGGTKIEAVAMDPAGHCVVRTRVPTPVGDYTGTVSAIAALAAAVQREIDAEATVGIGTPGSISPQSGVIRNANSTALNGKPLARDLEAAIGRPIRLANDADCFALSEALDGAASGAPVVFGVILGTGVGGGVVVGGRLVEGANGIAGEWGHNPLPWMQAGDRPVPQCYCGKTGCIETYLCGPALTREYQASSGENAAPTEIARRAGAGDKAALACLELYEDRLARALAGVINVLDPHVIVLGGGVSNIDRLYDGVPALLPRYVFSDVVRTRIVSAAHGDSSGVRGAAFLWV